MSRLYDTLIGIPWFRAERYAEARAGMADAERLPASYEEWRDRAERRIQQEMRAGHAVERVNVDVDDFLAFCDARGLVRDGTARQQFAQAVVAQRTKAVMTSYAHPDFRHGPKGGRGGRKRR